MARAPGEDAAWLGGDGGGEAELLAHHDGVVDVPPVVTHRAPLSVEGDLYAALQDVLAVYEAHLAVLGGGLAAREDVGVDGGSNSTLRPFKITEALESIGLRVVQPCEIAKGRRVEFATAQRKRTQSRIRRVES